MSCHKYRHSNFKVRYRYVDTAREQCVGMIVAALLSFEGLLFVGVTYCIVLVCFWTTVCKTVRPMLSVSCLSVCPVLSVTFVHCGQTVGRIKMKLGMQVGRGYNRVNFGALLLTCGHVTDVQ